MSKYFLFRKDIEYYRKSIKKESSAPLLPYFLILPLQKEYADPACPAKAVQMGLPTHPRKLVSRTLVFMQASKGGDTQPVTKKIQRRSDAGLEK